MSSHRLPVVVALLCALSISCWAGDAPHAGTGLKPSTPANGLKPIAETLAGVDLTPLAALPVQHGGRYKPLHSLAMEVIDGITTKTTLGKGHTPVSSLLDLIFCRGYYEQQPIAMVKHVEMQRDLALSLPENERDLLRNQGLISPARLADDAVQKALDDLGRLTAKTRFINQVRQAHGLLNQGNLVFQLKCLALPDGPHSDRWRGPAAAGGAFADALNDFAALARFAPKDPTDRLDRFARATWNLLPLGVEAATALGLAREDLPRINQQTLWPLWNAIADGKLDDQQVAALAAGKPAAGVADAEAIADGLGFLAVRWTKLGVPDDALTDKTLRPALDTALTKVSSAWSRLGGGWIAARLGQLDGAGLQTRINDFAAACAELRDLDNRDRAARGLEPLIVDSQLELAYWRWNGFTGVAWAFLFAVPLLALGSLGSQRWALWLGFGIFALGVIGQIAAFVIRAQLAHRIPLANLFESMAAAALLASLVAVIGETVLALRARRAALPAAASASASVPSAGGGGVHGALALAAALFGCVIVLSQAFLERHDINAFISPQMPILSEFWLRIHTACIVSSYGLIGLGGLMSLTYLVMRIFLRWDDTRCASWDRTTFAINSVAMVVLWVGVVLGAVWAAVSWGRPWGWDPKEVFALLTWVVYIMLIHLRVVVRPHNRAMATAIVSLAAFAVMAFNWYIVNVVLAGLHSYA